MAYQEQLEHLEVKGTDLLALKVLIYSVGKVKNLDKDYQREFLKNAIQLFIDTGKGYSYNL